MKKILILLITLFTLYSCNHTKDSNEIIEVNNNETKIEKIKVTTSIIPLASITNYIGGNFIEANSLVPAGVSPHGFNLTPSQMVDLEKSGLIVHLGIDHVDGFLNKAIRNKNNLLSVNNNIEFLESVEHEEHGDEHGDEHGEAHSIDPHIWGNGENAVIIAKTISDRLSIINPENKNYFEANLKSFKNDLELTKNDFKEMIKGKKQADFIVFHDAYNYLFKELNIDNTKKHIFRSNVLSDPNSNDIKELIDKITQEGITVAYREPQLDSSNLTNLSKEYNLEILILDPLGTDISINGYINNYKNNLKNLEKIYE